MSVAPHQLPKRAFQDIRPRSFVAPHTREPVREDARIALPIPPVIPEDTQLNVENHYSVEDQFGTDDFVVADRNPKRAFADESALTRRSRRFSEVPTEAVTTAPTLSPVSRVRHSLAGKNCNERHLLRTKKKSSDYQQTIRFPFVKTDFGFSTLRQFSPKAFVLSVFERAVEAVRFSKKFQRYAMASLVIVVVGWLGSLAYRGILLRGEVLGVSRTATDQLQTAVGDIKQKDFSGSQQNFEDAAQAFGEASKRLDDWNGTLVEVSRFVPGASQLASGKYALEAGQHFALAGAALNGTVKDSLDASKQGINGLPLLSLLQTTRQSVSIALNELQQAGEALDKVQIDDLPQEKRDKFLLIKENLPTVTQSMRVFLDQSALLADVFGANGPRKYLFLLQNNQEMRATGGFIGTYALLDIQGGRVRKFFVDGIFNPDGQLNQSVVPPVPLQKVTGAWSLHDSNWFPDFPMSAEKAVSFYEKTGGPTVDGVITLTPTVIQKLLALTGPITLDEYGVTLDADNFMALVQDQVEFKYDKQENRPKKILADLVPLLLDRLTALRDVGQVKQAVSTLESMLNEKHILFYARNSEVETQIREAGWSGEVLATSGDYLSVINTNIGGYKTDGVIDQSIDHRAEIQADGSIVDTVTITRKHTGGSTPYDFWNRVNADYMRVYVPSGSTLLGVSGQTRETVNPPLDYAALHFATDPDVAAEEHGVTVDPKTGTRIYVQSDKTVFANWVYVSPGETATVTYSYRLPFRAVGDTPSGDVAGSYSVLFQKQSGSLESKLTSTISHPKTWRALWQTPDTLRASNTQFHFDRDLRTDRFYGIVFGYSQS